jgi:hypothetical protein
MGFASKTKKRQLHQLRQITSEFNTMDVTIQRVGIQSGDTLFFKVGKGGPPPNTACMEAFLQHLHTRGFKDCMVMIVGPDDDIQTLSGARLDELATAGGYVKGDLVAERNKGRRQVLNLLRNIATEPIEEGIEWNMATLMDRVEAAIGQADASRGTT